MSKPVLEILLKRIPEMKPAVLKGYHRYCVEGKPYPAIRPSPDTSVEGMVLTGLSELEMQRLEVYEDDEYTQEILNVLVEDEVFDTVAYVWKEQLQDRCYGIWSFETVFKPVEGPYCIKCQKFVDANYSWSEYSEYFEIYVSLL